MKLCVFCGTFNPIHNVHLALANYIKTHFKFDTILFIPAYKPPHKHIDDDLANHRYAMVKLAIEGVSGFNISNIEFRHERFSYTVNTMEELYKMFPAIEGKISFIIGTDAFRQIEDWYETDRLKELVDFVVFPREDNFKPESLERFRNAGYNFICVDMPFINLSSTVLRSRIKHGKPIGNLVPQKVQEYIKKNGLYLEDEEKDNEK